MNLFNKSLHTKLIHCNLIFIFTEDDEAEIEKKDAKKTRMKTRDKKVSYVS